MNFWTERSIEFANQRNYLDCLFRVYPVNLNLKRPLEPGTITNIEALFERRDSRGLLEFLLKQKLFPIKDSYVAYLRHNPKALNRNPLTCARLASILYEMGVEEVIANIQAPKEANRQMGPLFKH